jgi:Outer membrane lipoprotein-sorting protein
MKSFRRIAMSGLTVALSIQAFGASTVFATDRAAVILERVKTVNEAREPRDVVRHGHMVLTRADGTQQARDLVMYLRNYPHWMSKSVTYFVAPIELRNVGLLTWTYDNGQDKQAVYFPETQQIRHISKSVANEGFGGSDYTYEDSRLFSDLMRHPGDFEGAKLIKDGDDVDGSSCAVLQFDIQRSDVSYRRIVMWIDRTDYTMRKLQLFERATGRLDKAITLKNFLNIDGIPTPLHVELTSLLSQTRTVVDFSDVRYNQGLKDDLFSEAGLSRGPGL